MTANVKKLLSLLLCLVMVAGLFPASALAEARTAARVSAGGRIGDPELPVPSLEPRPFEPGEDFDEDAEEPVDYFSTFDEESGINVVVEAPMGSLPLLAEVRVQPVDPEAVQDAVEGLMDGGQEILVAMDISFWLGDDEIEPEEPVQVRVAAPELEGATELTLVHLPDAAEPESVELIPEEELAFALGTNEIAFEAESFSVYAVLGKAPMAEEPTADGNAAPDLDFSLSWISATDSIHSYDEDGTLICSPGDSNENVTTLMRLNVKYNAEPDEFLEVGAVQIVIPYTPFLDWDNGQKVAVYGDGSEISPPISWQIPLAPAMADSSSFNYTISEDRQSIILTNYDRIEGGMTLTVDLGYLFRPTAVQVNENSVYEGTVDARLLLNGQEYASDSAQVEVRTQVGTTTIRKNQNTGDPYGGQFLTWQDAWGEKPGDAEDYFYVVWRINLVRSNGGASAGGGSQPYQILLEELGSTVEVGGDTAHSYTAEESVVGVLYWNGSNYSEGFTAGQSESFNLTYPYTGIAERDMSLIRSIDPGNRATGSFLYSDVYRCSGAYVVLTRYPKSLLAEAAANGVDLTNEGLLIRNTAQSSTVSQLGVVHVDSTASATTRFTVLGNSSDGEIGIAKERTSHPDAQNHGAIGSIAGARSYLTEQQKPITFTTTGSAFSIKANVKAPCGFAVDPETGTATVKPYTLSLDDYQLRYAPATAAVGSVKWGDRIHSQEELSQEGDYTFTSCYFALTAYDGEYLDLGDGQGAWKLGEQTGYENYGSIDVQIRRLGEEDFSLYGTVTVDGEGKFQFQRAPGVADGVETLQNVSKGNSLPLPADTTELKADYHGSAYSVKFTVFFDMRLNPTEHVRDVVSRHEAASYPWTYVTNDARYTLTGEGTELSGPVSGGLSGEGAKTYYLTSKSYTLSVQKAGGHNVTSATDVREKATQYWPVGLSVWPQVTTYRDVTAEELAHYKIKSGVFYDLLPPGCTVDLSSVKVGDSIFAGTIFNTTYPASCYTAEVVKNWNGTGRDLLIVNLLHTPSALGNQSSAIVVVFNMYNSYGNIVDRGTDVTNVFGFLCTDSEEETDFEPYQNLLDSLSEEQRAAMQAVVDEYGLDLGKMMFAQKDFKYSAVTVTQTGLSKTVSSGINQNYLAENEVYLDREYSYRLSFSQEEGTLTGNLVFYDILDQGHPIFGTGEEENAAASEWQGSFVSILLPQKPNYNDKTADCAPVVYYAAEIPTTTDLTDASVWSTEQPEHVAAVAVDCRKDSKGNDFVLESGTPFNIYITMKAPNDTSLAGKTAVNGVMVQMDSISASGTTSTGNQLKTSSRITLLDPMLELHKSSDPVTGTQEEPTEVNVGDTVTYTLAVSAGEEAKYALTSVKVEDPIPAGMTVNTSAIRYYTNSSASLQTPGNNKLVLSPILANGKLTFTIPKLEPGVTIYLQIPAKVEALEGTADHAVYRNQAQITGFDGYGAEIYSEETWHQALQVFYVYHSSDNTVEKIRLTDLRVTTVSGKRAFNIANETKEGSLYGGYYKAYPAASEGYESAALSYDETGWSKDEGGTPYGGSKALWSLEQAYTADGRSMNPVAGETYYLKEVPEVKYLQPYLHYTYKKPDGEITRAWAISAIDDLNYQQAGFVILDKNNKATICDTLAVTATGNNSTVILKPETVFQRRGVTEGYLDYLQVYDWDGEGNLLQEGGTILQYWVTPDGLMVTGVTSRVVTQITNKNTITRTDTPVKSTIETFSGN